MEFHLVKVGDSVGGFHSLDRGRGVLFYMKSNTATKWHWKGKVVPIEFYSAIGDP